MDRVRYYQPGFRRAAIITVVVIVFAVLSGDLFTIPVPVREWVSEITPFPRIPRSAASWTPSEIVGFLSVSRFSPETGTPRRVRTIRDPRTVQTCVYTVVLTVRSCRRRYKNVPCPPGSAHKTRNSAIKYLAAAQRTAPDTNVNFEHTSPTRSSGIRETLLWGDSPNSQRRGLFFSHYFFFLPCVQKGRFTHMVPLDLPRKTSFFF